MKMKAKTYTRPEEYICEQFGYIAKLEGYTNQVRIYYVIRHAV